MSFKLFIIKEKRSVILWITTIEAQIMVAIESKFVGDFKVGDNIVHNLEVLELLYTQYAGASDRNKRLLCKPITVLLVSILDAVLYDLHYRIRTFTREGVRNVIESSAKYIRGLKKMDQFEKCIKSAEEHGLLEDKGGALYKQLDELRRLRNRIHIQNKNKDFEADEYDAFNENRKVLAEKALENTLRIMAVKYERNLDYVKEFKLPWETYFPGQPGAVG
jgi:hypothetical protein